MPDKGRKTRIQIEVFSPPASLDAEKQMVARYTAKEHRDVVFVYHMEPSSMRACFWCEFSQSICDDVMRTLWHAAPYRNSQSALVLTEVLARVFRHERTRKIQQAGITRHMLCLFSLTMRRQFMHFIKCIYCTCFFSQNTGQWNWMHVNMCHCVVCACLKSGLPASWCEMNHTWIDTQLYTQFGDEKCI